MEITEIWQAALGEMEVILSKPNYSTWFKNTNLLSVENSKAIIGVPNAFTASWLKKKYHQSILDALNKRQPGIKQVEYQIASRPLPETTKSANPSALPSHPVPKNKESNGPQFNLRPDYIFDNFVTGPNNRLAFASAQAVAQNPGRAHNPFFIYGGVGLGKTHLLHAIGNYILRHKPKANILYLSCEDFCNEYINSIQRRATAGFKKKYRNIDVFLVDDIQFLSRKEGTQEEFFHTYNALYQKNRQIIMTSDKLPRAIPHLEDRLSSRFGAGLVADIQPPNSETRQAILRAKAQGKGWNVPNEAIEFIALNLKTNVRELEGALNRLVAQALITGQEITEEFSRRTLEGIIASSEHKNFSPDTIIKSVAKFFSSNEKDLLGKSRERKLVRPRQIIMYLLREELKLPFPKIGEILGGKDHSTIMHGHKLICSLIKKDGDLNNNITLIKESLYGAE